MIERTVESNNLIITRCSGELNASDSINSLDTLYEMTREQVEIYEIVINESDLVLKISYEESLLIADIAKDVFRNFKNGSIAFVCETDLLFGLCRQMQSMCENEHITYSVHRSLESARLWIQANMN